MISQAQYPNSAQKIEAHRRFWNGEGPCLILIPTPNIELYDLEGYPERFENPQLMWEAEMRRAELVRDWPTDGIPTVRPSLGVIFIPATMGLSYLIHDGQMPWPGESLSRETIRRCREIEITQTHLIQLAEEFYRIHRHSGPDDMIAYHADTEGVFDIAHLVYGNEIFCDMADESQGAWIHELMEICLDFYVRIVRHLKGILGETNESMIHGHGTPQGVYFPTAGTRISEDTVTLVSPKMVDKFILPYLERSVEVFGGGFVHYCGYHETLFESLCRSPHIRAIDLGNSDMHDLRHLFECCAETGTVLCSRVAALDGENWREYVRRVTGLIQETGARCILRPMAAPENRDECAEMLELWHEGTIK